MEKDMTLREPINGLSPMYLEAMRQRIQALYRQGSSSLQQDAVLTTAFEELRLALDHLQMAEAMLREQHEQSLNIRAELEQEFQRYKDLFEHAPVGYIITNIEGTIRQANPIAAAMLQSNERALVGRALALFLPEGQRRAFREMISHLVQEKRPQAWEMTMRSWNGLPFEAEITVNVRRGSTGQPIALYWLIRDTSTLKRRAALNSAQQSLTTAPAEELAHK